MPHCLGGCVGRRRKRCSLHCNLALVLLHPCTPLHPALQPAIVAALRLQPLHPALQRRSPLWQHVQGQSEAACPEQAFLDVLLPHDCHWDLHSNAVDLVAALWHSVNWGRHALSVPTRVACCRSAAAAALTGRAALLPHHRPPQLAAYSTCLRTLFASPQSACWQKPLCLQGHSRLSRQGGFSLPPPAPLRQGPFS